jgi:hypothetical protein
MLNVCLGGVERGDVGRRQEGGDKECARAVQKRRQGLPLNRNGQVCCDRLQWKKGGEAQCVTPVAFKRTHPCQKERAGAQENSTCRYNQCSNRGVFSATPSFCPCLDRHTTAVPVIVAVSAAPAPADAPLPPATMSCQGEMSAAKRGRHGLVVNTLQHTAAASGKALSICVIQGCSRLLLS